MTENTAIDDYCDHVFNHWSVKGDLRVVGTRVGPALDQVQD
ncbi:hypothetical protein KOR42_05710 [Thalassoglobus neptunius]|uniref:Uncharacterized protein n=1 Tax=Thalassoglobus neptunius TaxID=1938619 RepID=A0A5C5X4R0_9PLAN|nr:hypothetical protein KOR42_05710 [Thalassoglobus neptunius]